MREIRPILPDEIDDFQEIYLNAYPAYKDLDEACYDYYRCKNLLDMETDKDVEFLGCYEDGALIATMKIVRFTMNLYGEMKPVCALMALGVHRLHKKQHAALDMVREFERRTKESRGLVCLLLPFTIAFYRRMGYGLGTRLDEYRLPTAQLPAYDPHAYIRQLTLRILSLQDVSRMISCYDAICEKNHGMLCKFSEEKRLMAKDQATRRIGVFDGDRLIGYLSYDILSDHPTNYTRNTLSAKELVYEDGQVLRLLLDFIRRQRDLAAYCILRTGEEDFYHILSDPTDRSGNYIDFGYLQTNLSAVGTMYKIPDPLAFVRETAYARFPADELTALFQYSEALSGQAGKVAIRFTGGRWRPASEAEADRPDITVALSEGDLASLFLGSCSLTSLIRLGQIRIKSKDPAYAARLSTLLRPEQKPWSNNDY